MSKLNCIRIVLILSGAIPALVGRVPKKIHKATNTTSTHNRICEHAEDERPPCTVVRVLLVCTSGTTVALELRPATPPAIGERLRWFTVFAVLNAVDDATPPPIERSKCFVCEEVGEIVSMQSPVPTNNKTGTTRDTQRPRTFQPTSLPRPRNACRRVHPHA